ncbi:hypothetical protein HCU64_24105 [Methylobacterium sp. C25]|uniref:hypothetical protein n=1 Tax=Methylobacterium sp. C25 TaxID=2721622 RepID=UPI001F2A75FB|nr:hypothetical protein [Methylobacterium sp. C25]MCE4226827.1 hypothetical protein [Methylobacterium sp. C25]
MQDEVFADSIGEITVTGHTVRIDMASLSPTDRDSNNNPTLRFRMRVVMPVDGFANAVELMQKVVGSLADADLVARKPEPERTDGLTTSFSLDRTAIDAAPRPINASPNFKSG